MPNCRQFGNDSAAHFAAAMRRVAGPGHYLHEIQLFPEAAAIIHHISSAARINAHPKSAFEIMYRANRTEKLMLNEIVIDILI